ncbi:hypothetical protein [Agathobaculum massiliense]|uniref:hypothetical protein n=1 Tax=Agathobaculum massiliense TaxID=3014267 RepID=UPI0036F3A943
MKCSKCGTEFEGNFCSNCGAPAKPASPESHEILSPSMTPLSNHEYYDKEGDLIDLAVIYGVYKTRIGMTDFFRLCTDYTPQQVSEAVTYIEKNITPAPYSKSDAARMRKQIEAPIIALNKSRGIPSSYTRVSYDGGSNDRLKMLLVSWILGLAYSIYIVFYFFIKASSATDTISALGTGIAAMLVTPHIICVVIATIFNIVGWYMNKRGFVLTGAILYAVSILMFPLYFLFVVVQTVLSFVGFAKMPKS